MDPNTTAAQILALCSPTPTADPERMIELAHALCEWLDRGGFAPTIHESDRAIRMARVVVWLNP